MTRKTGWEEPSTGPDWTDVEMLMRAIGAVHSAHVELHVSPSGIGSTGGVEVQAVATFELLPGSSLPKEVVMRQGWPCSKHRTLAAHAFSLLHELDYKISQVYQNEALWN